MRQFDAEGRQTRFEYDNEGRLLSTRDGNGNTIYMEYDGDIVGCSACGGSAGLSDQPTVIVFPSFTREIIYDLRGRKYAERDLLDNQTEHQSRYTYDAAAI